MSPAKSIAAGLAIAAVTLAIAYADRPAFLDHWFYRELVGWQTGLGALFGLLGLAAVAAWNFKKTRDRDKELRQEEARALANLVHADLAMVRAAVVTLIEQMKGLDNHALLGLLRTAAEMHANRLSDFATQRSDLRILPMPILGAVFPTLDLTRDLDTLFAQFIRHGATHSAQALDDEERGRLVIILQTLRESVITAMAILAHYGDTGEVVSAEVARSAADQPDRSD